MCWQIMTMWNQDTGAFNYDVNLYGAHPFYLEHRQLGKGVRAVNGPVCNAQPQCRWKPEMPAMRQSAYHHARA